ncbi:MAG: YceI family protein [Acidobacteriota bacterium]
MKHALILFAFVAVTVPAAEQSIPLTPENTKIEWVLTDPLHTVRGTFKLKSGTITFDPESGKAGGSVVVDVKSGESGSEARDRRMHANVLESAKYPEAVFTPDRVEGALAPEGLSRIKVHGAFRIHGADHEMTMSVQATQTGGLMAADITFDVPYVAWGMKDPSNFLLRVGKTVRMNIHVSGALH